MGLDGQHFDTLISDPQGRSWIIAAIEEFARTHPGDEKLPVLDELRTRLTAGDVFVPAGNAHLELLQSILGASLSPPTASIFRPPAAATRPAEVQVTFLERQDDDDLGSFIDRNLEQLGLDRNVPREERARLVADLLESTVIEGNGGIRLASVKQWGKRGENGEFVEPRNIEQVLKVYEWLDAQAAKHGVRIDVWDFLATIYPPVRQMLEGAGQTNGEIVVRVPKFLERLNFGQFSYATFARAAKISGLITEIPDGTVGHHMREEVERPKWETLNRYAEIISSQADGDDVHHRQIFDFLVFLRLLPILKTTATARDMADRSLTEPAGDHRSRYSVRVVPESELVEYISFGETARFSIQRWPFSDIASGHFDRMLEMLERRIEAFETFRTDIDATELAALRSCITGLRAQHATHKTSISDPSADRSRLTLEYLSEIRSFYRQLDRFFKQTVFFTHARGSVAFSDLTVSFEIVPQIGGIKTLPVVDGRITVFVDDILSHGFDVDALFKLRLLTTWHAASGIIAENDLEDPQRIYDLAKKFDLGLTDDELLNAARTLTHLNQAARSNTNGSIDPDLHRAIALRTTGGVEQREYYVYDLSRPWREHLAHFYNERGFGEEAIYFDTSITEDYFRSVRHPHYIFNSDKLDAITNGFYDDRAQADQAKVRIMDFLRHINVRTEPSYRHPLSPDDTSPQLKAIEWAFRDYLENFPGAGELGARIEVVESLLSEVVDRQIAEHPDVHLRRGAIRRGVIFAIDRFNEKRTRSIEGIGRDLLPLPDKGIFPQRFYAFLEKWGRENLATLALDKQRLLLAYSLLKDRPLLFENIDPVLVQVGISEDLSDENSRALFQWGMDSRHEIELIQKISSSDALEVYLKDHYEAPLISATTASKLMVQYLTFRLTTPQPVDINSLIVDAIGDRFDPYPTIKAEVVAFYHIFIREFLWSRYTMMTAQHDTMMRIVDIVAEQTLKDPLYVIKGISEKDFIRRLLSALDMIPAEVKEAELLGMPYQYHPSLQEVIDFNEQTRLVAEALGETPPTDIQGYIGQTYVKISDAIVQRIEAGNRRMLEQEHQLILAEIPIKHFWERVKASLAIYSQDQVHNGMERNEIRAALETIEAGMVIIAGLETELNDSILTEWSKAAELAWMISDDNEDNATEIIYRAESLIASTKNHLEEQQLLLQIQLEEHDEMEARQTADNSVRGIIDDASVVIHRADEERVRLSGLRDRIKDLSNELKVFSQLLLQQATPSLASNSSQWEKFKEHRKRMVELRKDLDALRTAIESISPADIYARMVTARDALSMSDAMKAELSENRVSLVQTISRLRGTLEQAEMSITRLGGTLSNIQDILYLGEKQIPPPSSVNIPATEEHLTQSMRVEDRHVISFNTTDYSGTSKGRMTKVMEDIERIQVFASGDEAYLVGQRTAGLLTTWIASNRSTALDITDIFGRSIIVEPGTHGVRIFDRNETGIPLVQRMAFALQTKNYEADLIARLFETTTRSDESRELWQRFLLEMANEDIRSHRDAVLFVRRFAIAYKEEIDSIRALARNNWFTKEQAPIQIELSSDEADDVMSRTSDQISVHLDALQGAQNKQLVRDMAGDLSTRIKEHLSTGTLEWWNARETEGIPHELGILWGILDRGHNGALLKKMLLLLLSFQIETDVRDGMDTLPADLTPLLRTALRFIMENIIEIRFGDILYLDGKLRYDLKKHRSYAEITRVRLDHPELRTVLFSSKFDPRKRIGMLVSEGDYDRIIQHSRTIGRGRISFEYFNIDSGQMEPTSFEMDGAVARPSPLDEYAHIIYEIFSEPRLLALGYMISSISNLLSVENSIYNAMVRLFDKHRFPVGEPQSSKIRKLIDLERDMEILFRKRLMEQEERPAAPESTPQQRGPGITIEGFLDDETELTVEGRRSGTIVLDIHDQTSLFHDGHAHRVIESSLENNLGGFKDLPSQTRRNMVRAIANMAQLRPGEPITVTQQALTNYYASMGMTMPAMIRPFTIPNFFMMNLMPKIR